MPSCLETRGFGSPGYTNIKYPHKLDWPRIRDRQSGEADYHPVASYRRRFTVPADWAGHTVLVNGRRVKFKGVNRHETSPDNVRTVTLDEMLEDILMFKRYNIDTVRTSHYPNHHLWYDLTGTESTSSPRGTSGD